MASVDELVRSHYGGSGLEDVILRAVMRDGSDTVTVQDLAHVDQLHAGGAAATGYLLEQLDLGRQTRLLDVGCGLGGPGRVAAETYGCPVVGVDLSPDFIAAATKLTHAVGLSMLVQFEVASGSELRFDDGSFDRAIMVHVGMNIPDKAAVFAEVRRVLRPGSLFGLYEQMHVGQAPLTYPLPWAEDERSSFVTSPESYAADLTQAGFEVERTENRAAAAARPAGDQSGPDQSTVFGARFRERIGNNIAATRAGVLAPMLMVARAR